MYAAERRICETLTQLRRYETQEIESLAGLKGHEDWIRADELDAALVEEQCLA